MELMIFFLVFMITTFAILIGLCIANQNKNNKIKNRQYSLNVKTLTFLKETDFKITNIFYITDNVTYREDNIYKKHIIVDKENKLICLLDYNNDTTTIVKFSEIINYEIYENKTLSTSGVGVGGLISLYGAESSANCKELKLIIRVNNYEKPQIVYNIISDTLFNIGSDKNSNEFRRYMTDLQNVVSFLEVIKNENQKLM